MLPLLAVIWTITTGVDARSVSDPCKSISKGKLILKKKHAVPLLDYCECEFHELVVKNIKFSSLPKCLFKGGLKKLSLENTGLVKFPGELLKLLHLESLSLKSNSISTIPSELSRLTELKRLDLRQSSITSLPQSLGHVERIDLRNMDFSRGEQNAIREQYPNVKIFFSSPCNCN
jgi:Leucine-rich repeat (LRR) protein